MAPIVRVVAAVIARGDRVLICQRPFAKRHGGLWEFPGGKREVGESDASAVARELREELGVEVVSVGRAEFTVQDPGSPFLIVFTRVEILGEPRPSEHVSLRWASQGELDALPLAPSDRMFVDMLVTARDSGRTKLPP
jgi:8-oxo-dGTP diphosphatase